MIIRIILYISLLLVVSVDTGMAAGSSVYGEVTAGSSGNHLAIRIRNSTDESVMGVRLEMISRHSFLQNFIVKPEVLEKVEPGKSAVFDIFFAVDEEVGKDINRVVKFRLSAAKGRFETYTAALNLRILADKKKVESPHTHVVEKRIPSGKMERYVYVLTEIAVQDISYSDGSGTEQTMHDPDQLGYITKYSNAVYTKVDQIRCIDCPTRITLGESIHFKFDYRSRYDSEKFQCEEKTSHDYWPPTLLFGGKNIEAVARGKSFHFPSCRELGLKGHETQNDPNSRAIIAGDIVYDPVGLTLDESVSLSVVIRFTGDATDRDSVFYNDPTFSYTAEYTSDGKLFKEFKETEITVEYDDTKLKTKEHLKENRIRFSINGMSLTYTLQVDGAPESMTVSESMVAPEFGKPALGSVQVAGNGKPGEKKIAQNSDGGISVTSENSDKNSGNVTARPEGAAQKGVPKKWPAAERKQQKGSVVWTGVDPHDPEISFLIRGWLNHAEPLENAKGAKFRYDKWGRLYGTAANGGIITLNSTPDNLVSSIPEVHVWAHRQMLDSTNLCKLEEYVIAKIQGKSLAHCFKGTVANGGIVPDFVGFKAKTAKKKLQADGYTVKLRAGKAAATFEEAFTVAKMDPKPGSRLIAGETIVITVFTNPKKKSTAADALPDMLGQKAKVAKKTLRDMGYRIKIQAGRPAPSAQQAFTVKSMDPAPGTQVKKGDEVVLVVFVRPKKLIQIPELTGLSNLEAKKRLTRLGLRSRVILKENTISIKKSFQVFRSEPPARTKVAADSTVKIIAWDSFQQKEIIIPDVLGRPVNEAVKIFRDLGLKVDNSRGDPAPKKAMEGRISVQIPGSGTRIKPNSEIKLQYFGRYEWSGPVPDLRGLSWEQARRKLTEKKLETAFADKMPYADSAEQVGKVISQSPAAGSLVQENDTITITVYGRTRQQEVAKHSCAGMPNTESFWDYSSNSPRCRCKPGFTVRADKRGCKPELVAVHKKPSVIKRKGKAGGREFILDKVVYSKYVAENDLCGQTMTCRHEKYTSSGKTKEKYYSISEEKAEFRFKEISDYNGDILSDYQAVFLFDSPPGKISAGDILQLNINAKAQGVTRGWFFPRTFGYYLKIDGGSHYLEKQDARVSNTDLPTAGKGQPNKGKISRKTNAVIKIPEKLKTLVIGAKHGWDPGLYVEWIYKPTGNKSSGQFAAAKKLETKSKKKRSTGLSCNRYENCFRVLMQETQNMVMQMMRGNASQYACQSLALNRELFRVAKNARSNGCTVRGNLEQSVQLLEQTARQMCRDTIPAFNADRFSECRDL